MPTMPKTRRAPRIAWDHQNRWPGYNTRRWREASLQFKINNPLCCTPGCNGATYVTDHNPPISSGIDPWNQAHWQPLCKRCHTLKTSSEGGSATASKGRQARGRGVFRP